MPLLRSCLAAAVVALLASLAIAQPSDEAIPDLPVPARLSLVEGSATFWRPGDKDWSPAQVNTALVAGDALSTGERTNIEIQIGPREFLRLMANTQVSLVKQQNNFRQFRVAAGNASFDLRGMPAGQHLEIDTPNAAFVADSRGYFRIDVSGDTSRLTVRYGGHALLSLRGGRSRGVIAGEQIAARGATDAVVDVVAAPAADSWDQWNDARSDYYAKAASNRYLAPEIYGSADLDPYGVWRETPDYGAIWIPAVAPGWSPYTAGNWRWDPIYEWTWIDRAPWGWATTHYGRWLQIDGYWAWAPGPWMLQPIYVPATVVFYGPDGSVAVDATPVMTGVVWVALSWGEPIIPWWGRADFRRRPWWGGWGGPRVVNNVVIHHRDVIEPRTINYRNRPTIGQQPSERRDNANGPAVEHPRWDRSEEHRPEPSRSGQSPQPILVPQSQSSLPHAEPRFIAPAVIPEQSVIVPHQGQRIEPVHASPPDAHQRSSGTSRNPDDDGHPDFGGRSDAGGHPDFGGRPDPGGHGHTSPRP
jgi:FecR protein